MFDKPEQSTDCIGLIAGRGQFPLMVAQKIHHLGMTVAICAFHGHVEPELSKLADNFCLIHLGQLGKLIKFFKKQKVRRICFAGSINKPKALSIRPDFRTMKILFKLRGFGDDALLRAASAELEKEGFTVVQAASFVSGLHAPLGILTRRRPSQEEWEDILYAWPIAQNIGKMDIGQCIVVRRKMVMAIECIEGTDITLTRGGDFGGPGCIAVKILKPGQDERLDLPAIGLATIRLLLEKKFSCLVYQAGKTLFFDREESLIEADKGGLCIIGLPDNIELGNCSKPASDKREEFFEWLQMEGMK